MTRIRFSQGSGVYLLLLLMVLVIWIYSPSFFKLNNVFAILRQASALGILTIGQALVIVGGGVDLSVETTMQMGIVIVTEAAAAGGNAGLMIGLVLSLFLGLAIGLINGLVIARLRVQPFLVTLFTGTIITGIRLAATNASPGGVIPEAVRFVGRDSTGPIPNAVIVFAVLAAIVHLVLKRGVFGRRLVATGFNPDVARLSNVKIDAVTLKSYCISGVLAIIAGLVLAGYVGYADQWIGKGYTLDSLAAAILGGNLLGGGRGSITGAIGGVLLMSLAINIVLLFNLEAPYQYVTKGAILVLATLLGSYTGKRYARRTI
jgi:ribose/xylose/arabinose/galactoside ABC-type transport system permease subunit